MWSPNKQSWCVHSHTITESQFWERSIVPKKVYFFTISALQLAQELNEMPDIHQTGHLYFSSLHVSSENKTHRPILYQMLVS